MATSPCIKVCIIHPETQLCEGCLRTLPEIARWGSLSDIEHQTIMAQIEQRKRSSSETPEPQPS